MTADEAKAFEHANIILQALGVQERVEVVLSQVTLRQGDVALLCSDGLHGPVGDEELLAMLDRRAEPAEGRRSPDPEGPRPGRARQHHGRADVDSTARACRRRGLTRSSASSATTRAATRSPRGCPRADSASLARETVEERLPRDMLTADDIPTKAEPRRSGTDGGQQARSRAADVPCWRCSCSALVAAATGGIFVMKCEHDPSQQSHPSLMSSRPWLSAHTVPTKSTTAPASAGVLWPPDNADGGEGVAARGASAVVPARTAAAAGAADTSGGFAPQPPSAVPTQVPASPSASASAPLPAAALVPAPRPAPAGAARACVPPAPAGQPAVAPPVIRGPTQPLENLIGRTLNHRYLVEDKIGEGGFGAVFRGKQIATGREVALKILHPHNVHDETIVARFRREAEACSKLRDPHTVTTYDFDETPDGILYLAMELLRGRSLHHLQKAEGPLGSVRVLRILDQVAASLGEAHANGIVHRDMKPENVFIEITRRRGPRQGARLRHRQGDVRTIGRSPALTAVGQTLGTLEFMSPEQLRGQKLDGRSDIYALGMMAYEMLTGKLPFQGAKTPIDIINFHMKTRGAAAVEAGRSDRHPVGRRRDHPQDGRQGPREPLRRRHRPARRDRPRAAVTRPHPGQVRGLPRGRRHRRRPDRRRRLAYFLRH